MGYFIHFTNTSIAADDISSFNLDESEMRLVVNLKTGKEHSFSYATSLEAKKAYNSVKASMVHAGFDGDYIS
ncbi:hypothetical protein [Stenotrophomonas maltophilia]|nr:hypothetical protein [Stenotrophomonas maltophilia]